MTRAISAALAVLLLVLPAAGEDNMGDGHWNHPYYWAAFSFTGRDEAGPEPIAVSPATGTEPAAVSSTDGGELAVLTSWTGEARLRRGNSSTIVPVRTLQLVHGGDWLELAPGARAVLICRDDNLLDLRRSVVVHEELCRLGTRLPKDSYARVRPRGGRIQRLAGGFKLPRRDKRMEYGDVPVVLSPRRTTLLEGRPTLFWTEVPGTVEYTVEWSGWSSTIVVEKRRQDLTCRHDEMLDVETRTCSLRWPEEQPALEPGAKYFLKVFARREGALRARASDEVNSIDVLEPEKAEHLRIVRDRLDALKLDDDLTREELWAGFHLQDGVRSEAIAAYRRAVALHPSAEVYNTLGDAYRAVHLYRFALESYRNALGVSGGEEGHAAAQIGLGLVAYAWGEYPEALTHAQIAHETYRRLQLPEETVEARRLMEDARKRTPP